MGNEVTQRLADTRTNYSRSRNQVKEDVEEKRFPLGAEPALIHPQNTSIVKVRDNGMIDIFVGTDNGIRIDPENRSITQMSNALKTKNQYEWLHTERNRTKNIGHDDVTNVGNEEIHNVKNSWTVHAGKHVNVVSDGSIYMEARDKIHMKSPHIHLDATVPPDQLDPVRPPMGLMYEEDTPYGLAVPFGYRVHVGAQATDKKARYRREEYDDRHADAYEQKPSLRGADKIRKDGDGEWQGPVLRKKYELGRVSITAGTNIDLQTFEKDGHIDIRSSDVIDIHAASRINMTPMPEHKHPEYRTWGDEG